MLAHLCTACTEIPPQASAMPMALDIWMAFDMAFMSNIKPQVEFDFNPQCVPPTVYFGEYSAVPSKLGNYIKPMLKDLKMTQTQLAEAMDVSINAVSN